MGAKRGSHCSPHLLCLKGKEESHSGLGPALLSLEQILELGVLPRTGWYSLATGIYHPGDEGKGGLTLQCLVGLCVCCSDTVQS